MIESVLLDLGGVVYVGDAPLPGALEALARLRASGLPLALHHQHHARPQTRHARQAAAPGRARRGGGAVHAGAMAAGLVGLLVQTGKYRPGDEARITPPPSAVLADLSEAVDWILARVRGDAG